MEFCTFRLLTLEENFENLITGYINTKVGISQHFLSNELAQQLKENLLKHHSDTLMHAAGTGNAGKQSQNTEVRRDKIYWLDRKHNVDCENAFFDHIEAFIRYLNKTCFTGITGYQFHYSLYEAGSFYKQHLDQFKNNNSRKFSLISYLNSNWQEADGGQLLVQEKSGELLISPTQGKTVFFKSDELLHEVLLTNSQRLSVTGWLTIDN